MWFKNLGRLLRPIAVSALAVQQNLAKSQLLKRRAGKPQVFTLHGAGRYGDSVYGRSGSAFPLGGEILGAVRRRVFQRGGVDFVLANGLSIAGTRHLGRGVTGLGAAMASIGTGNHLDR